MKTSHRFTRWSAILLISTFSLPFLTGCKPSEKNYQAAYQAAKTKKAKDRAADEELGMPELISDDGPRIESIEGIKVNSISLPVSPEPKGGKWMPYNVATGAYKMPANASSHTERLAAEGYESYMLRDASGMIYVCAGGFGNALQAAEFAEKYASSHPKMVYPGFDRQQPLLIISNLR